jgi:hypothetical protein
MPRQHVESREGPVLGDVREDEPASASFPEEFVFKRCWSPADNGYGGVGGLGLVRPLSRTFPPFGQLPLSARSCRSA